MIDGDAVNQPRPAAGIHQKGDEVRIRFDRDHLAARADDMARQTGVIAEVGAYVDGDLSLAQQFLHQSCGPRLDHAVAHQADDHIDVESRYHHQTAPSGADQKLMVSQIDWRRTIHDFCHLIELNWRRRFPATKFLVGPMLELCFGTFHSDALALFAGWQEFNSGLAERLFYGGNRAHARIDLALFQSRNRIQRYYRFVG